MSGVSEYDLSHINGKSFCLVMMQVIDMVSEQVKLTPIYGTARVLADRMVVEEKSGSQHVIPDSALTAISLSDGNEILKDAEYYVIVKIENL